LGRFDLWELENGGSGRGRAVAGPLRLGVRLSARGLLLPGAGGLQEVTPAGLVQCGLPRIELQRMGGVLRTLPDWFEQLR
jgi:hypothetical protein